MSQVNIVGFYSPSSGHGKDTMAKLLLNNTLDVDEKFRLTWNELLAGHRSHMLMYSRWQIKKFAYGIKQIVADLYGVDVLMLEDREWRLQEQPPYNKKPLDIVISVGEAMREIVAPTVWSDRLFANYTEGDKWLISDVRFPYEYQAIKERGGIVVKVFRNDCQEPKQALDGLLDDYQFDETIINDMGKWAQSITQIKMLIKKYDL